MNMRVGAAQTGIKQIRTLAEGHGLDLACRLIAIVGSPVPVRFGGYTFTSAAAFLTPSDLAVECELAFCGFSRRRSFLSCHSFSVTH